MLLTFIFLTLILTLLALFFVSSSNVQFIRLLSLSLIVSFKYHSSSSINSIKFYRSNSNSNSINKSPNYLYKTNIRSNKLTQHNLFLAPQIAFVASCVAAVVTYVALNIDDIKEKQKIATDKAMVEQTTNIKSAVDSQKAGYIYITFFNYIHNILLKNISIT